MKTATLALIASATALASAQVTFNSSTGTYTCAKAGAAYCAGDSLNTDIIIRCDESGAGQPGRCSDNLDGEPPVGDYPALCWQTSESSGDAACEKNCVVYGASGNYDGTFTLPASECEPTYTASSSSAAPSTSTNTATSWSPVTTSCSTSAYATGSGSYGVNGTTSSGSYGHTATATSAKTPTGPYTSTGTGVVATAGAAINNAAGGLLAAVGLVGAYIL